MNQPQVKLSNGSSFTFGVFPILMLSCDPPNIRELPFADRPKDNSFKINPRNQFRVVTFLKAILEWFTDPNYTDLFIIDETTGRKMLNMDYRDLQVMIDSSSKRDQQRMLAVPAVVKFDDEEYEGCTLFINQSKYAVMLTYNDVAELAGLLNYFSFQEETTMLVTLASHREFYTDEVFGENRNYRGEKVNW